MDTSIFNEWELALSNPAYRSDDWESTVTGIGTYRDKSESFKLKNKGRLSYRDCKTTYQTDGLGAKIVDTLANEMTREQLIIKHDYSQEIINKINSLSFYYNCNHGFKTAFWSGGAVAVLDIEDGRELNKPVYRNSVKFKIKGFSLVVDKEHAIPKNGWNPIKKPEIYYITGTSGTFEVHVSRLLFFESGVNITLEDRISNNGWSESVYTRIIESLKAYGVSNKSITTLITEVKQGIFKLKDLNKNIKMGLVGEDLIRTKVKAIQESSSFLNHMIMDVDDDFVQNIATMAGIGELINIVERWLCAVSNLPHTILFGESPGSSLSQTGLSQQTDWINRVTQHQNFLFSQVIAKILDYIALELKIPEIIKFTFANLWKLDEKEESEKEFKDAQTYAILIKNGVLTKEEVRLIYLAKEKYSILNQQPNKPNKE